VCEGDFVYHLLEMWELFVQTEKTQRISSSLYGSKQNLDWKEIGPGKKWKEINYFTLIVTSKNKNLNEERTKIDRFPLKTTTCWWLKSQLTCFHCSAGHQREKTSANYDDQSKNIDKMLQFFQNPDFCKKNPPLQIHFLHPSLLNSIS